MNCLDKLVKFLNEYDIPDALVKAFKHDCQNLEDCLDKDCFPVITTPKENNKFLSLVTNYERYEICDDPESGWKAHACEYLMSKSHEVAKYYYERKDYNSVAKLVLFNPSLTTTYPEIAYLFPESFHFATENEMKYAIIPMLSHNFYGFKNEISLDYKAATYLTEMIKILYHHPKGYKEIPELQKGLRIIPLEYYYFIDDLAKYPEIAKKVDYVIEEMLRHNQIDSDEWRFCQYFASLIRTYKRTRYVKDLLEITVNAGGTPGW